MNPPVLEIDHLSVKKEGKQIIKGLDLSVREEEILGILGYNGAGKTTLAYTLMGLKGYQINSGTINYQGQVINALSIDQRAKLGISLAWQEPARFEGITVREYLGLGKEVPLTERENREYLERVGLNPLVYLDRLVDEGLSGGERKKVEIAGVLSSNAKLIILDEPDSGIDVKSLELLKHTFKEVKEEGKTLMLITHQIEIAEISDRVAILCDGRIERMGEKDPILAYFKKRCEKCEVARGL